MEYQTIAWAQLPEENPYEYQNFMLYLELGQHRSYRLVSKLTGIGLRTLAGKASKFKWHERAREYDRINFIQRYSLELDHYRATKERYIKLKNDINSRLVDLLSEISSYYLDKSNSYKIEPYAMEQLRYYSQIAKTIAQINKSIDFDKFPKIDIPNIFRTTQSPKLEDLNFDIDAFSESIAVDKSITDDDFSEKVSQKLDEYDDKYEDEIEEYRTGDEEDNEDEENYQEENSVDIIIDNPRKPYRKVLNTIIVDADGMVAFKKDPKDFTLDERSDSLAEYQQELALYREEHGLPSLWNFKKD